MSTLQPRTPYTKSEPIKLYPEELELTLVQVILRHGERAPTTSRFENIGLSRYWPYCNAAKQLRALALTDVSTWDTLQWRRRVEGFGDDDRSVIAMGPSGEIDGICHPGELTDQGRKTTYQLGQRLRHLYVDQLGFMPSIPNTHNFYLRATEVSRAIESAQQTWWGMYPIAKPLPPIFIRPLKDETLFPNDFHCQKFDRLLKEFGKTAAIRWNKSEEMNYLNDKLSKWLPSPIAVDVQPKLYSILDTINATLAHGPETRLPDVFYESKVLEIINKIECDEWFSGYSVNHELRSLGIGAFVGDVVDRMVTNVNQQNDAQIIKFALYGCHDSTLASFLASFGTFDKPTWPKFSSHVAVELFRRKQIKANDPITTQADSEPADMIRRAWIDYSEVEREKLNDYHVRLRYNDEVLRIPGCAIPGRHLDGDDSFCTLEAFKRIADSFVPKHWKSQCAQPLEGPIAGMEKGTEQPSGHIDDGY